LQVISIDIGNRFFARGLMFMEDSFQEKNLEC
jgi:hypothetical protein